MKKIFLFDGVKIIFRADAVAAGLFFLLRLLQALVPTLQTLAVAAFIDRVTMRGTAQAADVRVMLLILLLVSLVAFSWLSKSLTGLLEQHMEMRLRASFKPGLVEKISRFSYEVMENGSLRDKISRISQNAEGRVREAYGSLLLLLELIVKAGGILVILFTQVWWLAFVFLAVSVPCFFISIRSGKENYEAQADVTKENRLNEYYNEMLKGREYVDERTLFGYQREYRERFLLQYERARRYTTAVRLKWFVKMKAGSMAVITVSAVSLAVMIPLTLNGALSLGMFIALTNAVFGIVQNMSWDLTYSIDKAAWYQNYFRELSEVFALPEDAAGEGKAEKEGKKKEDTEKEDTEKKDTEKEKFRTLEFQNVSFRYPGTERYILKNLSFQLQAGKKYALVGANGAGKTTIVKLINGLYRDYEGKILVNGEDIRNFGRDFLSNVFQDFARYPVSIRENITIGRKDAVSDEELWAAVEEVGLTRTIEKLKDGLDTVLGKAKEESLDLSGGQWQKLALARCALSRGELRILDEPTSAMDPVYESEIYQSFRRMSEGKTVLLITHRLASVKMSDHIFVISDGTVAEEGSHAQLMEAERAMPEGGAMSEEQAMQEEAVPGSGLYRRMYEEQAKWYEEGGARV